MTLPQLRDAYRQFSRNFKWGTCGGCPIDTEGHHYPEFCPHRDRYDHNLSAEQLSEIFQRLQRLGEL